MTDDFIKLFLLVLASVTLPVGYVVVCMWLLRVQAWWFTYISYFSLFGTLGGWAFAMTLSSPALFAVSAAFLEIAALAGCIGSSMVLTLRKQKSWAEWIALTGGFLYTLCLSVRLGITYITESKL